MFWSILNYPFIHFPGYKEHVKDLGIFSGVPGIILGIDENGDMSIVDFMLNIVSLIPGGVVLKGEKLIVILKKSKIIQYLIAHSGKIGDFFVKKVLKFLIILQKFLRE